MDTREETRELMKKIGLERAFCANELKTLPKGSMEISVCGNRLRFQQYQRRDGKCVRRGIGKDEGLVRKYSRKRFLKQYIGGLDHDYALLQKAFLKMTGTSFAAVKNELPLHFRGLPDDYFGRFGGFRPNPSRDPAVLVMEIPKGLGDYHQPMDAAAWAALPYAENTRFPERKTVRAANGLLTRSKSEAEYSGFYDRAGIVYHYDETFYFIERSEYDPLGTIRYISPDFVLLRADGSFLFHEHFGLTDDVGYMRECFRKVMTYIDLGIMPGRDLLITFERPGGGVDLGLLKAQLAEQYYI